MSRVNGSLVLVAVCGLNLACAAMAQSPSASNQREAFFHRVNVEQRCEQLRGQFRHLSRHDAAKEFYKSAFKLSFDQKWEQAELLSQCASLILNGKKSWPIEAKVLIK